MRWTIVQTVARLVHQRSGNQVAILLWMEEMAEGKDQGTSGYMVAVVEVSSFAILLVHACVRCAPSAKLLTIVVQHSVLTSEKS